ncbi:MAG: 50S ribosomal protein L21e [Candidatus Thermoplasmatota archaeon]
MRRSRGFRSKTRKKLEKKFREGEMNIITRAMQKFEEGEKVAIVIDPSVHYGMPHPRYQGKTGSIAGKQGRAYILKIRDGNKIKHIIAYPEHLKRVSG